MSVSEGESASTFLFLSGEEGLASRLPSARPHCNPQESAISISEETKELVSEEAWPAEMRSSIFPLLCIERVVCPPFEVTRGWPERRPR